MIRIFVQHLTKTFDIGFPKRQSFLARTITFISRREPKKHVTVLDDVTFSVRSGELLGIIGGNGSGKSTLLRIISGIFSPDGGSCITDGKTVSLINLGSGLKTRLTMRENIFLVGSIFGMRQWQIESRVDSIVEFSGLQEFINTKLYQFSAGMAQRLVFSVAIHADPDILLLDEVFEVGDEQFRQKSARAIIDMAKEGKVTVVLVTHDLALVEKYCERVMWLEQGVVQAMGAANEVLELYRAKC